MTERPELLPGFAQLEEALKKNWRLGQNMVLCWSPHEAGVLALVVPHYFLGNLTASAHARGDAEGMEQFVRGVIGTSRLKSDEELFAIAQRLQVSTTFIKLDTPFKDEQALQLADQIIRRYGLGFVESRAVILFDIAEFSLQAPFEQASQLNSLSYSMNSAYTKLGRLGIDVNFARTTTGDGYYVWNRDLGAYPDFDLLTFLLLVLIDNAAARQESTGNTVPLIRTGFHVGSHYELFQAEGVNPTLYSYIVGDVTIALARMLEAAEGGQILMGDFVTALPTGSDLVGPVGLLDAVLEEVAGFSGLQVGGSPVGAITSRWSGIDADRASHQIVDKHGLGWDIASVELDVSLGDRPLSLGRPL